MKALRRACWMSILALVLLTTVPTSPTVYALPKKDDPDNPTCQASRFIEAQLRIEGLHLDRQVVRGRPISIVATSVKLAELNSACQTTLRSLPANEFSWQLSSPLGSNASLNNTNSLTVGLTPDLNGDYTVTLTACPGGCSVVGKTYAQESFPFTLTAVASLALPPGTEPVLPAQTGTSPSAIPDAAERCLNGGGVTSPQWVTVNNWSGAANYELLEGQVGRSRISRKDNFLNHDSQDHNMDVKPDPNARHLLRSGADEIEVEWERNHFPEAFRATPGDRISTFGYWVLDCGHDYKTEIHPPVGVAVHRARPVLIPSDQQLLLPTGDDVNPVAPQSIGSNVYVPGIVTDIFFSRRAGEITNNCSATGLHQPGRYEIVNGQLRGIPGACIREPSPLNRIFTFHIYLPERPALQFRNEVPLYTQTVAHPFGFNVGPEPTVELINAARPYLQVTLDLRNFTGDRYARRIMSGWALASPTNWELRRWKVRIPVLDVHDDGDGRLRGDGDWRFWIDLNNGRSEWTKMFDCDGCVHGRMTFAGRPWQTGEPAEVSSDRSLGPDLLLFPSQRIWVHSSGFEADWTIDDDTGSVNDFIPQQWVVAAVQANGRFERKTRASCTSQAFADVATTSGCADYTLEYEIVPGPALPAPSLSDGAQRLFQQYTVFPASDDPKISCLPCIDAVKDWYVYDQVLTPVDSPVSVQSDKLFNMQRNPEPFAMTDISLDDFRATVERERVQNPASVDTLMRTIRADVDANLAGAKPEEVILGMQELQTAIPPDLWQDYFSDLKLYSIALPLVRR